MLRTPEIITTRQITTLERSALVVCNPGVSSIDEIINKAHDWLNPKNTPESTQRIVVTAWIGKTAMTMLDNEFGPKKPPGIFHTGLTSSSSDPVASLANGLSGLAQPSRVRETKDGIVVTKGLVIDSVLYQFPESKRPGIDLETAVEVCSEYNQSGIEPIILGAQQTTQR